MAKAIISALAGLGWIVLGFHDLAVPPPGVEMGWVGRWDSPMILWILGVAYLVIGFCFYHEEREFKKFMREHKF